jgi:hypothetical protein
MFHFSAFDFDPEASDSNIEIVDETNENDKKDTDENELFYSGEFHDLHSISAHLGYILHQLEMKTTPHFCEIPSPPPDLL